MQFINIIEHQLPAKEVDENEKWKDIKMYDINFNYQVSNLGHVKNTIGKLLNYGLRDGYPCRSRI